MIDIYLLDKDKNKINIIDNYKSLIWASRYNEDGDCEIMISATIKNFKMIKRSVYLAREDDDMVCHIEKIQLLTDTEDGNYLIITGYDIKRILAQRIVWQQTNFEGLVEDYIRRLIIDNIIEPIIQERKINDFILEDKKGFIEEIKQQVTYDNLEEKIQLLTKKYNWGYKVSIDDDKNFVFSLYKGKDRSMFVVFSHNYENISSSEYSEDITNIKNVVLTAGEGEGNNRSKNIVGDGIGLERYELYVDAREISKNIGYDELLKNYPGGKEVKMNGILYYQHENINVAILTKDDEDEVQTVELTNTIYDKSLESKGLEELANHKSIKIFKGSIEPNQSFIYKKDYFLGDIVTVENEFGISAKARITEIIEKDDDEGYGIEPIFEYLEEF